MKQEICSLNGNLLPLSEAKVAADDGGLLYGDGIFETMRVYRGQAYQLKEHLQRLQKSAAFLALPAPDLGDLHSFVEEVIAANNLAVGSMRLSLTSGINRRSLWPRPLNTEVTILITVRETTAYPEQLYLQGSRAVVVSFPRNEASPLVKIKSLNYLENMLGKKEALQQDCLEGLFLNTRGELTEGTTSNLFLFDGETLLTPSVHCGLLPGITRSIVLELARKTLGLPVKEAVLYRKDFEQATEVFLTASIMEIMPLVAVDDNNIADGNPGPLTRKLLAEYRKLTC